MNIAYVVWEDAMVDPGESEGTPTARIVTLHEVGFLLDENENAILIGMEYHEEDDILPGRWHLHIPKTAIKTLRVMEVGKAFPKRSTFKLTF